VNIAVWYHCALNLNLEPGLEIIAEQMSDLCLYGLAEAASEIHVGCNGDEAAQAAAATLVPPDSLFHGFPMGQSELSTMRTMQEWLPAHRGWIVFYFHQKGLSQPTNPTWRAWRNCMMRAVIWNWQACVNRIETGAAESCGAHWLTPEKNYIVKIPMWGGNFWAATTDFLLTLPPLPTDTVSHRYDAEVWIGRGPRRPRVIDYAAHWPSSGCIA
jgi:hypothetical protein